MTGQRGPISMTEAERKLRGDAGKRGKSKRSEAPSKRAGAGSGSPKAPPWIEGEALQEWQRVVPVLERMGYLEQTDRGVLAMYCQAWAHWLAIELEMRGLSTVVMTCPECGEDLVRSSYLVEGARRNLVKTPLWQMWRQAAAAVDALARQLALTPNARIRLTAPAPPVEDVDPLDEWGAGGA